MNLEKKEKKAVLVTGIFVLGLVLSFITNVGLSIILKNKVIDDINEIKRLEKTKERYLKSEELFKIYLSYFNFIKGELNQDPNELIDKIKIKENRGTEEIKEIIRQKISGEVSFSNLAEGHLNIDLDIGQNDLDKFVNLYFQELLFFRTLKLNINFQNQENSYKINLVIK